MRLRNLIEPGCLIIRSANKKNHFKLVQRATRILYTQMLFFDDDSANSDVASKGITFCKVGSAGLDIKTFRSGLRLYHGNASGRGSDDDSCRLSPDEETPIKQAPKRSTKRGNKKSVDKTSNLPSSPGTSASGSGGGDGTTTGGDGPRIRDVEPEFPLCGNPRCGRTFICPADYAKKVQENPHHGDRILQLRGYALKNGILPVPFVPYKPDGEVQEELQEQAPSIQAYRVVRRTPCERTGTVIRTGLASAKGAQPYGGNTGVRIFAERVNMGSSIAIGCRPYSNSQDCAFQYPERWMLNPE
ncbi:hypothetical protein DFH07DRAFT_772831 [Mycena maculata]|uniref:Uncharacterized protein n=1 Tax=Mycena maculata TaxID=230809 RepID=A0AAD7J5F1_9AGAR|nr:hypothetical protein DFH07DRAFT_772831 [Mycena maculata]